MKVCKRCNQEKDESGFYVLLSGKGKNVRYRGVCRQCHAKQSNDRRREKLEQARGVVEGKDGLPVVVVYDMGEVVTP
jgi:hypothetical protein